MEIKLNLTFEEGMKVVEAMKKAAIETGWVAEELDENGVIEEYCRALDAALTAMNIKVCIAGEPEAEDEDKYCDSAADDYFCNSDEEEQDEDEDNDEEDEDDDDTATYSLTAKGEFVLRYMQYGHSFEEACGIADILFGEGE